MMTKRRSKKMLQVSLGICALAPFLMGLLGMAGNHNPIYPEAEKPAGLLLDSNLRFLNGLSVGIGICTLWIIPGIQRRSAELRMICFTIFLGAIGRLLSVFSYGLPPFPFSIFPFLEVTLPLLLVFWQSSIVGDDA